MREGSRIHLPAVRAIGTTDIDQDRQIFNLSFTASLTITIHPCYTPGCGGLRYDFAGKRCSQCQHANHSHDALLT